ncbi:uncharacterized protein LOC108459883 isoform X2 [Gossypium arboreum]|uniref:uncharacterized protein LOC108459883 isoform X2 n=1 Tax=Gossypium arboreum TaxID=29729 RepID=UPI0008193025|nr:uncharacterized protein LOC108459883 isoform X2 [Gossypium arboreum]
MPLRATPSLNFIRFLQSGLALPKKLKGDKFTKAILAFALPCLLLMIQPVQGAAKTPTLQYGTFERSNNALSTHSPPVNDPTKGCNVENGCRQFTLSLENRRGTPVEAVANVTMAEGTLNHRELGTEAIAAGIATWFSNKTESNSNTYGGGEEGEGWESSDRRMKNGSSIKFVTENSSYVTSVTEKGYW